ncbi:MAG: hypothetical protein OFPI_17490 [Osedax symbiont Rs2]|nr:MAG: hypothetical protein OFPI_17490 [Osedax symbiont Rs2]
MLANLANQQVYAGSCTGAGGVYSCSGTASTDTTQNLTGSPLQVTTEAGFGITVTTGDALNLTGTNGLTFTDNFQSTITTTDTSTNKDGIYARSTGTGALSITTSGFVSGSDDGIDVANANTGTDITITTASVTGGDEAIVVDNLGTGALTITATGTLIGNGDEGVDAENKSNGTDLIINTVTVTGDDTGIWALNQGSGILTITSTGTVTGTDTIADGINATNHGTDLTISTTTVSGGSDGIEADNQGNGALSITATGTVTGINNHGIMAKNSVNGTDININSAAIIAEGYGIYADNDGTGSITIISSGTIISQGALTSLGAPTSADIITAGIFANNSTVGTNLTINTASIIAKGHGIDANNNGTGALTITSTGTINSEDAGIFSNNGTAGTNLTINTASIIAKDHGVDADNDGTGALIITSSGTIDSEDVGIFANNSAAGTDLIITTAAITGDDEGIGADNYGSGKLIITATGAIVGNSDEGIDAENNGTDLIISTTSVTANDDGIAAVNNGSGALSITATGTVSGGHYGINADNFGGDLIISTASVTGIDDGINAQNNGSGALNITATGKVTSGNDGIYVENDGTDTTIVTSEVSATDVAISVAHDGSGDLNITTNGLITADNDIAIRLNRAPAGNFGGTINNNAGWVSNNSIALEMHNGFTFTGTINTSAKITGGNGTAIDASGTTTDFTINQTAGDITGDILLGTGDSVLNISGGTINGDIIGQGKGTVNADAGAGNTLTFYGITNVEDFNILSGTVKQLGDFSTAGTTTTIAQGATLLFSSVINGTGALVSNGNLAFTPGAQLNQTGTVTLGTGSTITANLQGTVSTLNQQQQYLSATSLVNNGATFQSNSLLYDAQGTFVGNTLRLESVVADLENISSQSNPSAFGAAMKTYIEGGANNDVVSALASLFAGDVSGFEHVANTFSPSVSGMIIHGSRLLYNENWRAISKRLLEPQADTNQGVWVQALGSSVNQGKVDDIDGFNSNSAGLSVGFDQQFGAWQAGVSLSQGEVSANNKRSANDDSDISSSQLTLYSSFYAKNWFAQFNVSAAMLDYKFERDSSISSEGRITGKSKGDLLGLDFSVGLNEMHFSNISFKPIASLRYSHLSIDDYTENGGLDLQVSYENTETLSSEIGLHAQLNNFARGAWQITPVANLSWSHEFIADTEQAVASFAGQSFSQSGASGQKDKLHLGLGLMAERTDGFSLGLQFSSTLSRDTFQPSAVFNMQYAF